MALMGLSIICKGNSQVETDNNPQYRVQSLQLSNESTVSINSDFTENDVNFRNHLFQYGIWSFYSLVYDGNSVSTFIDGKKVWSFPYSKPLSQNNAPLHIAKDIPGSTEFFCGSLDDLRIYNYALTELQVVNLLHETSVASYKDDFELECPGNSAVYTGSNNCFSKFDFKEPTVEANCGKVLVKQIEGLHSGSNFPTGDNYISFLAQGATKYKAICTFHITVRDSCAPTIICPHDTTITIATANETGKIFDFSPPPATDNCAINSITQIAGIKSGAAFPIGTTQLKFLATDKSGNSSECAYNVTVAKAATPIHKILIKCPKDVMKPNEPKKCGTNVSYELPTIIGADNEKAILASGYESGSFFDVGETMNAYKSDGEKSSETACLFKVVVKDIDPALFKV